MLKEIIRKLKTPLVPFTLYDQIREQSADLVDNLEAIKDLLHRLPRLNRECLIYLLRFFNQVAQHADKNLMNTHNLSVVNAPNVFRPENYTVVDMQFAGNFTKVFQKMIEESDMLAQ